MMRAWVAWVALPGLIAVGGCGGTSGSGGSSASAAAGTTTGSSSSSGGGGQTCPLQPRFGGFSICDVLVGKPTNELADSGGSGTPDLSCLGQSPSAGAPQKIKMSGFVRVYGHGCQSSSVTIQVHEVGHASANDGAPGALVGAPFTTDSNCKINGSAGGDTTCGFVYECQYAYDAVPTETELVVRTAGDAWATMYEYGLYIRNDAVKAGAFSRDVYALGVDDYNLIPQAAIGKAITPGKGMVLAQARDCIGVPLENAVVSLDVPATGSGYLGPTRALLKDSSLQATGAFGMFGAFDVPAGRIHAAAAALSGGKVIALGYARARVQPDSVAFVPLRGILQAQFP